MNMISELFYVSVRVLNVTTREEFDNYDQAWITASNHDYVIFRVKASANAHILLSDTILDEHANVYEVVLGINQNTQSVIRESKYGTNVAWVSTLDILSPDEVRFFWISWTDQKIQVGSQNCRYPTCIRRMLQ